MTKPSQTSLEVEVFGEFLLAAQLSIMPGSVLSPKPPAPDLFCEIDGVGPRYFEVTDAAPGGVSKESRDCEVVEAFMHRSYKDLNEAVRSHLDGLLAKSMVVVQFKPGQSRKTMEKTVPKIFSDLSRVSGPLQEGHVLRLPPSAANIQTLTVLTGITSGPQFSPGQLVPVNESPLALIKHKFLKTYEAEYPIDLLVYYGQFPPFQVECWRAEVERFVTRDIGLSPFERVWIFDRWQKAIIVKVPGE